MPYHVAADYTTLLSMGVASVVLALWMELWPIVAIVSLLTVGLLVSLVFDMRRPWGQAPEEIDI